MGIYKVELVQKHCVFVQADNDIEAYVKVSKMNDVEIEKAETYKGDMVISSVTKGNKKC